MDDVTLFLEPLRHVKSRLGIVFYEEYLHWASRLPQDERQYFPFRRKFGILATGSATGIQAALWRELKEEPPVPVAKLPMRWANEVRFRTKHRLARHL
jgi:hypothetical protein